MEDSAHQKLAVSRFATTEARPLDRCDPRLHGMDSANLVARVESQQLWLMSGERLACARSALSPVTT